jgi:hypothetical protein
MKTQLNARTRRQAGYSALFITLVLVGASVLVLGATLTRSTSGARLNDRNVQYVASGGAAEAAVEKVLARMLVDFANSGEGQVLSNINLYETGLLPTTAENPYWANFQWSDGQGNPNQIYVARTTVGTNAPYVALEEQYAGLSGYASTYRILANVASLNTTYSYNFTNAVQQDVQLAQIPVFQFAIFYNGLLEFSDTATLNVTGPVHANSNIYVGSPANLTFNSIVTSTGNITSPANAGYGTGSWTGRVSYDGTPTPGYLTGQPSLNLPIGTSSTSGTNVQAILYPPPGTCGIIGSEPVGSAMGQQRYYNKAQMTLIVSNSGFWATFKSAPNDTAPMTFSAPLSQVTSNSWLTNQAILTTFNWTTNWGLNWNWLSFTNKFYDWRENKQVYVTQIDVGKLTNWMSSWLSAIHNTNVNGKFGINNAFNDIYVADFRTAASTLYAVRLSDGQFLPSAGLTVATPNPIYMWGNYNCPAYLGTTNTTLSVPASVAGDAITILSPSWLDSGSTSTKSTELGETAGNDTINAAIIAGIVASTGTGSSQYSGGANNLPRLLEDWSSSTLTLNTSIICLFNSTWATGQFQLPGAYYYAPNVRNFAFNQNYTSSAGMPPGTPNICRLIRSSWCNPMPNDVSYPDITMSFVPH